MERRRYTAPPAIVLYTDAMYDAKKTPAGMVGIVIYDPKDPASKWRYRKSLSTNFVSASNTSASSRCWLQ